MHILNLLISLGFLFLSVILFSLAIAAFRFFWKRSRVNETVEGMESGIFVHHGMVVDPETGLVSSHKAPSDAAYREL